jgi:hypothetical protein
MTDLKPKKMGDLGPPWTVFETDEDYQNLEDLQSERSHPLKYENLHRL